MYMICLLAECIEFCVNNIQLCLFTRHGCSYLLFWVMDLCIHPFPPHWYLNALNDVFGQLICLMDWCEIDGNNIIWTIECFHSRRKSMYVRVSIMAKIRKVCIAVAEQRHCKSTTRWHRTFQQMQNGRNGKMGKLQISICLLLIWGQLTESKKQFLFTSFSAFIDIENLRSALDKSTSIMNLLFYLAHKRSNMCQLFSNTRSTYVREDCSKSPIFSITATILLNLDNPKYCYISRILRRVKAPSKWIRHTS